MRSYHSSSYAATGGHRQDIKDGRSHNRAHSDVALRDEGAYHVDEEFRSGGGRCHERGSRHIVGHVEC